jgi:hypothetical protein
LPVMRAICTTLRPGFLLWFPFIGHIFFLVYFILFR